jgi:hypothetical protein
MRPPPSDRRAAWRQARIICAARYIAAALGLSPPSASIAATRFAILQAHQCAFELLALALGLEASK